MAQFPKWRGVQIQDQSHLYSQREPYSERHGCSNTDRGVIEFGNRHLILSRLFFIRVTKVQFCAQTEGQDPTFWLCTYEQTVTSCNRDQFFTWTGRFLPLVFRVINNLTQDSFNRGQHFCNATGSFFTSNSLETF